MTVDLERFGALEAHHGFDLQRFDDHGQKHVVHVRFGNPSNAEWIASMALEWLEKRRTETERAFVGIEERLKTARGVKP